jgi:uncharacterized protein (DUF427 family)
MPIELELVGTIGGDGFLNMKWFYQCPYCKMMKIFEHAAMIPEPNVCKRDSCKD